MDEPSHIDIVPNLGLLCNSNAITIAASANEGFLKGQIHNSIQQLSTDSVPGGTEWWLLISIGLPLLLMPQFSADLPPALGLPCLSYDYNHESDDWKNVRGSGNVAVLSEKCNHSSQTTASNLNCQVTGLQNPIFYT